MSCQGVKKAARRCLFGRPDHKKITAWLQEEHSRLRAQKQAQYGFDFHSMTPLAGSSSPFQWTVVNSSSIPQYYSKMPMTPRKEMVDENRDPSISPEISRMDCSTTSISSIEETPKPVRRASHMTPKKRQSKLTDMMPVIGKNRTQRSPKRLRPEPEALLSSPTAV